MGDYSILSFNNSHNIFDKEFTNIHAFFFLSMIEILVRPYLVIKQVWKYNLRFMRKKKDFRIVNKMVHVFIFGTIPKKNVSRKPYFHSIRINFKILKNRSL